MTSDSRKQIPDSERTSREIAAVEWARVMNQPVSPMKEKLARTGIRMFREQGYDNVGVRDICRELGVTTGSFYHHFKNKDEILMFMVGQGRQRILPYLEPAEGESPSQRLISLFEDAMCGTFLEEGPQLCAQRMFRQHLPSNRSHALERAVQTLADQAIKAGELGSALSAAEIARTLILEMRGVEYDWCMLHPDSDLRATMRRQIGLLLEALKETH